MSHAENTITVSIISMITSFAMAQETLPPVWELSSNEIPAELQSGNIEKVDSNIALTDGAAFAIPAAAFKNPKNFTVQVTASIIRRLFIRL